MSKRECILTFKCLGGSGVSKNSIIMEFLDPLGDNLGINLLMKDFLRISGLRLFTLNLPTLDTTQAAEFLQCIPIPKNHLENSSIGYPIYRSSDKDGNKFLSLAVDSFILYEEMFWRSKYLINVFEKSK